MSKIIVNVKKFLKGMVKNDILFLVGCLCLGILIKQFIMVAFVPTGSMHGTVNQNDLVFVNKLDKKIERGDVIVFKHDNEDTFYLKRVIALPHETIEIKGTDVYIDGKMFKESYLYSNSIDWDYPSETLDKGEYFLMGDNRDNSYDSRGWGPVNLEDDNYIGKAVFRLFPLGKIKENTIPFM